MDERSLEIYVMAYLWLGFLAGIFATLAIQYLSKDDQDVQ